MGLCYTVTAGKGVLLASGGPMGRQDGRGQLNQEVGAEGRVTAPCTQTLAFLLPLRQEAMVPTHGSVGPCVSQAETGQTPPHGEVQAVSTCAPASCACDGLRKCGTGQSDPCHSAQPHMLLAQTEAASDVSMSSRSRLGGHVRHGGCTWLGTDLVQGQA